MRIKKGPHDSYGDVGESRNKPRPQNGQGGGPSGLGVLLELDDGQISVKGYEDERENGGRGCHVVTTQPNDTHRSPQVPRSGRFVNDRTGEDETAD